MSWIFWLVAFVVFTWGEMHTGGFFLAPFALGALVAGVVSLAGGGFVLAGPLFLVSSLAVFGLLRPVAHRHRRLPPPIRIGAAALVGKTGLVTVRIANNESKGCVKIDGEVWTARSFDDDEVIDAGERVHIVEIQGATALVIH